MHYLTLLAGICLPFLPAGYDDGAADDGPVRVKLVRAPLPSPEATLSPSDVRRERAYTRGGAVYPPGHVHCSGKPAAGDRPENVFTIGSTRCEISRDGESFRLAAGGAAPVAIPAEKRGEGQLRLGPVEFDLPGGGRYALAFTANVSASAENRSCVVYRSGLILKGEMDGLEVALYDGDIDGLFEREKDGVRVGPAASRIRVFAPCTGLISTGPKVYRCSGVAKDGSEASFAPYEGGTGRLAANFAAGGLEMQLVLASRDTGGYVVAGPESGEFAVAPGEYAILYGLAYDPKENDVVAVVAQGQQRAVKVKEGWRSDFSCGGPYRYVFAPTIENGELKIKGESVKVQGAGGEEYDPDDQEHPPAVAVRVGDREITLGKMRYG